MTNLKFADRVQETTVSVGTGAVTPGGVVLGYRSFAEALEEGDSFYYLLTGGPADPAAYEVGVGTFTGGAIVRVPSVSSAGGGAITLLPGTKTIAVTLASAFLEAVQGGGPLTLPHVPPVGSARGVTTIVDVTAPTLTSSAGNADGVAAGLISVIVPFAQGPTGETQYFDTVVGLGLNMSQDYAPLNPDMPCCSYRIESKFAQGQPNSVFAAEFHMAALSSVDGAVEYRAASAFVPHLSTQWRDHSDIGFRGARHIQWDGLLNVRVMADFSANGGYIDHLDGGSGQGHPVLRFNTNDRSLLRQRSADGDRYLALPYFDGGDALTTDACSTLVMNGPVRTANFLGQTAMLAMNAATGMTAGGYLIHVSTFASVLGTLNGVYAVGNASGKLENRTINIADGGKAGSQLRSSGGDLYREFRDEANARQFTHTYYAASATFRLDNAQQGGQFATRYAYEVDWAKFQLSFGYPPKLPVLTVATLPGAATAGAGAIAYCSDDGGGGVPVFSDGSAWRRMTDRGVASA